MFRRVCAVAVAGMAFGVLGAGVAQAAPTDAGPCKSGGYVNYLNPATGAPFQDQGQCVSFVRNGGTLTPVEEEQAQEIRVSFVNVVYNSVYNGVSFQALATGLTPGGAVALDADNTVGVGPIHVEGVADANGQWLQAGLGFSDCTTGLKVAVTDITTGLTSGPVQMPVNPKCT